MVLLNYKLEKASNLNMGVITMTNLKDKTIQQLLVIYNKQNPDSPLKAWKRKKSELLDKIKPLKSGRTIREAAEQWLLAKNGYDPKTKRDIGYSYKEILELIKDEFPKCKTTVKCLRWYSTKIQEDNKSCKMPYRPRS